MSNRSVCYFSAVVYAVLLLPAAFGQQPAARADTTPKPVVPKDPTIYLYNQRRDELAQKAEKTAEDVLSGQIFDTALDNLKTLSRPAVDRIFTSAHRAAIARLQAAATWSSILAFVETSQKKMLANPTQQAEWKRRMADLQTDIDAANTAAETSSTALAGVADVIGEVGNAQKVIAFAEFLQKKQLADVTQADLRIMERVRASTANVAEILKGLASLKRPATAREAVDQMKLDLWKAEIDYLNSLVAVEQRRIEGEKDVNNLADSLQRAITCPADPGQPCLLLKEEVQRTEEIETTLTRVRDKAVQALKTQGANPAVPAEVKALRNMLLFLQNWAAYTARAETPARLAALRSALEERRFQIRRDAILARSYEDILLAGTGRIAAYYRGGLKPETLAQFIQAASTAGLIPAIALK